MGLEDAQSNVNAIHLCVGEPTTFAAATTTNSIASKTSYTLSGPVNEGNGRKLTAPAVTDGTIAADGTPDHYALVDTVNSRLYTVRLIEVADRQALVSGNPWTSGGFDAIVLPGLA